MTAAIERAVRETDSAVTEERQRWRWAAEARRKGGNERPTDDVPVARENVIQENGATKSG